MYQLKIFLIDKFRSCLLLLLFFAITVGCATLVGQNFFEREIPPHPEKIGISLDENRLPKVIAQYYEASVKPEGIVEFRNKKTLLMKASQFSIQNSLSSKYVPGEDRMSNGEFEKADCDGVLSGWELSKFGVKCSGENDKKFLLFELNPSMKLESFALSPIVEVIPNCKYLVSISWFFNEVKSPKGTGGFGCWIAWYNEPGGKGACTYESFLKPSDSPRKWHTTKKTWNPPEGARSFRLFIRARKDATGSFSVDEISVVEQILRQDPAGLGSVNWNISKQDSDGAVLSCESRNESTVVKTEYEIKYLSPIVKCKIRTEYLKNQSVDKEKIDLLFSSVAGSILTRDMKMSPLEHKNYWSDLHTPKVLRMDSGFSLTGADNLQVMGVEVRKDETLVSLYSDNSSSHPYFRFPSSNDGKKTAGAPANETIRKAGDTNFIHFEFSLDSNLTPLLKSRQPNGYDAALVISEHADGGNYPRTMAVAYGTDNTADPFFGKRGIVGHGLTWTKSVFILDSGDAPIKLFSDLHKAGVEIVPHSVKSDGIISPGQVAEGLEMMKQFGSRNWIDHSAGGGLTHWEALSSQGAVPGGAYYILDILHRFGYRYAWAYLDYAPEKGNINIMTPLERSVNRPIQWRNNQFDPEPDPEKCIYLWATFGTEYRPDLTLAPVNIDRLIAERGISISHEYFGNKRSREKAWKTEGGNTVIMPEFDKNLEYIANKKKEGLLWVTTMSQLADYLLAWEKVEVSSNIDGSFTVTNHANKAIEGLTLLTETPIKEAYMNENTRILPVQGNDLREIILPFLGAKSTVMLKVAY